jgi:multidrug efflux system membrane fusion protein
MRFSVGEDPHARNGCAWAGETFQETQASVETSAGRGSSAQNGNIYAHLRAFTQEKTTGIDTMSIEDASETPLIADGTDQQPSAPGGSRVRIVIYVVLLCLAGLVVWKIYQQEQATKLQNANQQAALMSRPVPVQVAAVEQKPMPIFLTALGTVTPYMSVTVKARVSGELEPVKFTEGQQVKQGQTILVIDPRPYQAALDQAKGTLAHDQALLKNAQAEFARYKALYEAGVTSKEVMQTDEAMQGQYEGAIEADKAAVETAQLQLNWCTIKSPISGKIGLRLVDPGNIITANTTNLVIINQFQPISVYFTLPENQLPQVLHKLAAEKRLAVDAYDQDDTQKLATGYLLTADNQIDTTTGTGKLKAVFDNKDDALFPNQFVNIHLVMEERPNALVVPSAAIQTGLQGSFVWIVDHADAQGNGTAKNQPVKVALAEGQVTILDDGLQPGQSVVVDGADRLKPGQNVTASQARQRSGQGTKGQGAGQSGGSPFAAPNAATSPGAQTGTGQGKHDMRNKQ